LNILNSHTQLISLVVIKQSHLFQSGVLIALVLSNLDRQVRPELLLVFV
jgi:hypothetical protein